MWAKLYYKNKEIINSLELDYNNVENIKCLIEYVNKKIEFRKVQQFINRNFSKRYRCLLNNQSKEYIQKIVKIDIDENILKTQFFSTLKAFKTTELINGRLKNFLNLIKEFDKKSVIKKLQDNNINIIHNKSNILIASIDSYYQARIIGNMNWCISRGAEHFDNYRNQSIGGQFFFVWNFNKTPVCSDSMLAYNAIPTIHNNQAKIVIATKFNKNNDSVKEQEDKYIDNIVINNHIMLERNKNFKKKLKIINKFENENKHFKKFYKNRNLTKTNLVDNKELFEILKNIFYRRRFVYKSKTVMVIDKLVISKIDKRKLDY